MNLNSDLHHIPNMLMRSGKTGLFSTVFKEMCSVDENALKKYEYTVNSKRWAVYDADVFKITMSEDHSYNCYFSKITGLNIRFGKTIDEDPDYCELGPEILDCEIVTGSCIPVGGCNCKFCYKGNTSTKGKSMAFDTFKTLMSKFPKNLSQIAFGITSLHANKDFKRIVEYTKEIGIVPNVTTSGADLDEEMCDVICRNMGACAVSCYEADPDLCYSSIKRIHDYAEEKLNKDMHVNMHLLFSTQNFNFVMKTLEDIKDGKVSGLKSVVLLRLKNVGNAKDMDPSISLDLYEKVIRYCIDNNISFGFDSCGAKQVIKVLNNIGKSELTDSCESCESSIFSSYVNVDCEYTSCSFVEHRSDVIEHIDVLSYSSFSEVWNMPQVQKVRDVTIHCEKSCPWFDLDR